jgi:hypothetical protein
MKFVLIIFSLLFLSSNSVFAQTKGKNKPGITSRKDDNCMLQSVYGKALFVSSHFEEKKQISHKSTDFVQFNEDGTYTESVDGKTNTGTWTYDDATKTITVNCNGIHTWKLNTNNSGSYELSKGKAVMWVKAKQ